ncbi:MarR family transcriptional regulator [Kitasatospora sp. NPDC085879]|uniref:MarR family winged helix-turn-helix transcriptional regulator n=1 Tax=Kitasatospora sp. NPDC085879 TaxID=3154769 RepID=UPI00341D18D7
MNDDVVASVRRQWKAVHPELDTEPMELVGRINRCAALLQQAEDAPLRAAGLTRGEFDLLGAVRRTGRELTPGELARETFSSGAAVTKRLRALQGRGLIARRTDGRDRRIGYIGLTDEGRTLVDRLMPTQLAYERTLLAGLDDGTRQVLGSGLAELLLQLEGRLGGLRG